MFPLRNAVKKMVTLMGSTVPAAAAAAQDVEVGERLEGPDDPQEGKEIGGRGQERDA